MRSRLRDDVHAAKAVAFVPAVIQMRPFQPGDEDAFRILNEKWINDNFGLEPKDRETLNDPVGTIIAPGGQIFMALYAEERIGCCALLARRDEVYEVAKLTVKDSWRGRGIGRQIMLYTISQARNLGARALYLESSHILHDAIHLYESLGFEHIAAERVIPSPYARADVFMEMLL